MMGRQARAQHSLPGADALAPPPRTTTKAAVRRTRFSKGRRELFLDLLAATCHVERSAKAAGISKAAVYQLRRSDPGFARAWGEALLLGYQMLETHVVGHLLSGNPGKGAITLGPDGAGGTIDFSEALKLLTVYRSARGGKSATEPAAGPSYAQAEETDAKLLRALSQIARRRGV